MGKKTKKISFECIKCNNKVSVSEQAVNKRRYNSGEHICVKCYRKISRGGPIGKDYYPKELQRIWLDDVWDYDVIKPYLDTLRTKKKIRFTCEICGLIDERPLNQMKNRKICKDKPICRKCALGFATNTDEWRENNSKAQLIAQNRPEVLAKQRESQLLLMEKDPFYADKRSSKSFISGYINGMRFDSSWEMFYIGYCLESDSIKSIERYVGSIDYINEAGRGAKYFPDFTVTYSNSFKKIVEIKGSKKYNNFHEKFKAAKKIWGANYVVYGQKELYSLGIKVRQKKYWKNFFSKGYNVKFDNNKKAQNFKKEIEAWQKLDT